MAFRHRGIARTFGDLALRWKILVPFAFLAMVYGVSGTYVFSHATAAEVRAAESERLRDAASVAASEIEAAEVRLGRTTQRVVFTQGVPEAMVGRDRSGLRRLVLPIAHDARAQLLVVTDARGRALADLSGAGNPEPPAQTDWSREPLVRSALAGERALRGSAASGWLDRGGATLLAVAYPVTTDRRTIGAVVAGERLRSSLEAARRQTRAEFAAVDGSGRTLAAAGLRGLRAAPAAGVRSISIEGRRRLTLSVPVSLPGSPGASLVVALPARSGLSALGREAWKIALLAAGALGGVFLIGFWVARWISRPLGHLIRTTRGLKGGDLGARAEMARGDEIGELAAAFDGMAEQLEASHRDLETKVEERTRELSDALGHLDRANAELTRSSEAKSTFIASVSHELRTPLSGILIAAEMLHDPSFGSLPETTVRDLGGNILRSGRHLLSLIDDLLDLSRIEAGHLDLQLQPLPLRGLLDEVRAGVEPLARRKGVGVRIPTGNGVLAVADPVRLRQVMLNLLANAVNFTDPGGRVWLSVAPRDGRVALSVHDTGIGIDPGDLGRIFEPFEQVSGKATGGAGLGLAICKRIVELHRGTLTVSSEPGKGSTFTVTIAKAERAGRSRTLRLEAKPARPRRVGGRVLLVEDDAVTRDLVTRVLERGGFHVVQAASVGEALRALDPPPDLILLDIGLGTESGLDVVRAVRADAATSGLTVVALSAYGMPEDIARALEAGCDAYLVKPVEGRALLGRVREFLDTREVRVPESVEAP